MKTFLPPSSLLMIFLSIQEATSLAVNSPRRAGSLDDQSLPQSRCRTTRKDFFIALGTTFGAFSAVPGITLAAPPKKVPPYIQERGSLESGLGPCPGQPMKKCCWSTEDTEGRRVERWVPPTPLQGNPEAIAKVLEDTMAAYPQEGQNDVDKGGWQQAERNTDGKGSTYLRYEFTSGKFKYIDELELLVESTGKISVRTSSRSAGFDYNVNSTRLNYIQLALENEGWKVKLV
ncbi:Protein of unknown function (DUF1499) [Seminavis robusta]|uniref:Uncharacterized protein n=1 Tax=Seminavis robusta TaxID=568900 RepID=A0A9N8HLW3_9STRA|nr:Protein of unknown function (DUF1499) [Seminavis robusta]|eukprot:Sro1063_g237050.1 Protein of unknown function (DUF1499) (232) ;mRNA; r:5141-5836